MSCCAYFAILSVLLLFKHYNKHKHNTHHMQTEKLKCCALYFIWQFCYIVHSYQCQCFVIIYIVDFSSPNGNDNTTIASCSSWFGQCNNTHHLLVQCLIINIASSIASQTNLWVHTKISRATKGGEGACDILTNNNYFTSHNMITIILKLA